MGGCVAVSRFITEAGPEGSNSHYIHPLRTDSDVCNMHYNYIVAITSGKRSLCTYIYVRLSHYLVLLSNTYL